MNYEGTDIRMKSVCGKNGRFLLFSVGIGG